MTEPMGEMKRRMLAGEPYRFEGPELEADAHRCHLLVQRYNAVAADDDHARAAILRELLGSVGERTVVRPPLVLDYGYQTTIGARCFVNAGAVILDVGRVAIGDDVQIGPSVQLLTATHPLGHGPRRDGWESQRAITIADGAWLGGGVIVLPGVSVGENSVVGAGAVVTRDVPPGVVAVGNPCRVLRNLPA